MPLNEVRLIMAGGVVLKAVADSKDRIEGFRKREEMKRAENV